MTMDKAVQKLKAEYKKADDELRMLLRKSEQRGYDNYDHVEGIAYKDGYVAGIMVALLILRDIEKEESK